ncbi:hypothetical protein QCN29_26890 [Streptomyces sp. HNM0663]|uniref:Uncharacterized protein n=1 Tax=Streptomyces chengmaiensis TaxID=3040919 RepID=A0ABT6HUE7_9ACTN|nr:hypothetical protein [Streptomyces chengmaiensis]MDH2392339.1 hypothetical protein [Streptomyces chengmaiensis]
MNHNQPLWGPESARVGAQLRTWVNTRATLLQIADRLTAERPGDPMREATRLTLARRQAETRHGVDTRTARDVEDSVLRHTPRIERDITRGEYALILHRIAGGEHL